MRAIGRRVETWLPRALPVTALATALAGCAHHGAGEPGTAPVAVGRAVCAECHAEEAARWAGSHHDLAMQVAADSTVLADFDGATLARADGTWRFVRRGHAFVAEAPGEGGERRALEVAWTFGATPLQQYLVRAGAGGVQALPVAWDTRPAADGGQRWFDLFPGDPADSAGILAWNGPALNWNRMCAECHSTGLEKGWDPATERWTTTFDEVDVSCEACHGRGSSHVRWARLPEAERAARPDAALEVDVGDGTPGAWVIDDGEDIARLVRPRSAGRQVDVCARCHAHRARIAPDDLSRPLADHHVVSLLDEGLTWPDGQVLGEVFEYGSFAQSRMAARGVVCSDCHDPHTARTILEGDMLCLRCHRESTYATRHHHGHDPLKEGARCAACHMPRHVFMGVDARFDHGFRVPRPDLTATLGTPNACADCHADRDPGWARAAIATWGTAGRAVRTSWGPALDAARRWQAGAGDGLRALVADPGVPAIVRATALEGLEAYPASVSPGDVDAGVADPDPLVRRAAAGLLAFLPHPEVVRLGATLLADSLLSVRAAAVLPILDAGIRPGGEVAPAGLDAAITEYRGVQAYLDDGAEGAVNLGNLERALGRPAEAEAAYRRAMRRQPSFVPATVNLADLLRGQGRLPEAERLLRELLAIVPEAAAAHHSLGLTLVLAQRRDEAVEELRRAAEAAPDEPRFAFVLAVALAETGHAAEARRVGEAAARRFPAHPMAGGAQR